jgi:hypothetical protein
MNAVRLRWTCRFALLWCALLCLPSAAETHHVILCGSGGEKPFIGNFAEWGARLREAIVTRLAAPTTHVHLLIAQEEGATLPNEAQPVSLESIRDVFSTLETRVDAADDVALYIIGHGSYLKDASKFQIPGEDLTATALEGMLAELPAARVIVVNGTSSSAGFINALSGPNRVVCSATKSATESNATEFMGFFVEALEDGSADRNKDERISVLEACEQAAELTASWYTGSNLIATEHAILDDNGDGLGTRLPILSVLTEATDPDVAIDGGLAGSIYLKDYSFPEAAPKELIDRYLAALDAVAGLRSRKTEMPEGEYLAELERILLDAARANREIRGYAKTPEQQ